MKNSVRKGLEKAILAGSIAIGSSLMTGCENMGTISYDSSQLSSQDEAAAMGVALQALGYARNNPGAVGIGESMTNYAGQRANQGQVNVNVYQPASVQPQNLQNITNESYPRGIRLVKLHENDTKSALFVLAKNVIDLNNDKVTDLNELIGVSDEFSEKEQFTIFVVKGSSDLSNIYLYVRNMTDGKIVYDAKYDNSSGSFETKVNPGNFKAGEYLVYWQEKTGSINRNITNIQFKIK